MICRLNILKKMSSSKRNGQDSTGYVYMCNLSGGFAGRASVRQNF